MNRVINTVKSIVNPNVNSQNQVDEDGEYDGEQTAPAATEDDGEDDTPAVHSMTVNHNGAHTDIVVRVASPTGYQNKRLVLTGHLTAKRIADALLNVRNW